MPKKDKFASKPILISKLMNQKALAFFCGLAILSCSKDKLDFGMAEDIRLKPKVEAPLVKAYLSLEDLEEIDSNIVADLDNALRIRFRKDSIFSLYALDFVEIPEQPAIENTLSQSQTLINADIELGTLGGAELNDATFKDGSLYLALASSNTYSSDVDVEIILKNADDNGTTISRVLTLPQGQLSVEDSIDLKNVSFDFSDGGQKVNYIGLALELKNPSAVGAGESIQVKTQFKNIFLEEATGFFGQRKVNIPAGSLDFDISGISEFSSGLFLTEPSLKLIAHSSLGAPLGLNIDMDGVNDEGTVVSLGAGTNFLAGASSPGMVQQTVIDFTAGNSNIADFLANLPTTILYSGSGELNPGSGSANNSISSSSGITADIEVDVPLKFRAKNVKFSEVLDDIDFFEENPEEVEELTMIFYTDNGMPFDMDLKVSFLEKETGDSIQGIDLSLLDAAPVDANGRVIRSAPQKRTEVVISKQMLEDLKKCNKIEFEGKLNTTNNGSQVAALYTDYELTIKIAAKANLNLKISE